MTRIDAMSKLSVEMSIDGVKDNIALINEIYDHFEGVNIVFSGAGDDWGEVEGILLPDGEWIELGAKEEEDDDNKS